MNTAPRDWCQSGPVAAASASRRWPRAFLAASVLCMQAALGAEPASPTPPPAWQRELDAARTLQAAIALAPVTDPAADAERHRRLSELYGQLVSRYADQVEIQKAAGTFYQDEDKPEVATACWQRAEVLDPRDATVPDAAGALFLRYGRVRDACAQFERAVQIQPEVARYHSELANVLFLFRQDLIAPPGRPDERAAFAEALAHYRRAAELAPANIELAQAYAETFYGLPDPDWRQALTAWQAVLALSGDHTDFANGHLARISLRLKQPDEVEKYLDRIHSPAYDTLKDQLRRKSAALRVGAQ